LEPAKTLEVPDNKDGPESLTAIPLGAPNRPTSNMGPGTSQDQMRLLVAEDNRANRLLIKTMLKSAGHAIDFAEDGVEAVKQYIENRPDFVLMDLSMPNKNGFDATREIRAFEKKDSLRRCPIVAVTANVTDDDRRKCFDAGMDAFLPKPVKKAKLLETIVEISA
jgi:CheY-like chemotaxis protein